MARTRPHWVFSVMQILTLWSFVSISPPSTSAPSSSSSACSFFSFCFPSSSPSFSSFFPTISFIPSFRFVSAFDSTLQRFTPSNFRLDEFTKALQAFLKPYGMEPTPLMSDAYNAGVSNNVMPMPDDTLIYVVMETPAFSDIMVQRVHQDLSLLPYLTVEYGETSLKSLCLQAASSLLLETTMALESEHLADGTDNKWMDMKLLMHVARIGITVDPSPYEETTWFKELKSDLTARNAQGTIPTIYGHSVHHIYGVWGRIGPVFALKNISRALLISNGDSPPPYIPYDSPSAFSLSEDMIRYSIVRQSYDSLTYNEPDKEDRAMRLMLYKDIIPKDPDNSLSYFPHDLTCQSDLDCQDNTVQLNIPTPPSVSAFGFLYDADHRSLLARMLKLVDKADKYDGRSTSWNSYADGSYGHQAALMLFALPQSWSTGGKSAAVLSSGGHWQSFADWWSQDQTINDVYYHVVVTSAILIFLFCLMFCTALGVSIYLICRYRRQRRASKQQRTTVEREVLEATQREAGPLEGREVEGERGRRSSQSSFCGKPTEESDYGREALPGEEAVSVEMTAQRYKY